MSFLSFLLGEKKKTASIAKERLQIMVQAAKEHVDGRLAYVARELPLSRAAAVVRLAADLRRGEELLLFPEGTTTEGDRLAPFYAGSLRAAYRLGIPVLPLRLSCSEAHYPWVGEMSLLPHLWSLARTPRILVRVHSGPVLRPSDFRLESDWLKAIRTHLTPSPQEVVLES